MVSIPKTTKQTLTQDQLDSLTKITGKDAEEQIRQTWSKYNDNLFIFRVQTIKFLSNISHLCLLLIQTNLFLIESTTR